jgi:hypothetical protein
MIKIFWIFEIFKKNIYILFFWWVGVGFWLVIHWRIIARLMGGTNQFIGQHYLYQFLSIIFQAGKQGIKTPSFPCWKEILLEKCSYLFSYRLKKESNVILFHNMSFLAIQLNLPKFVFILIPSHYYSSMTWICFTIVILKEQKKYKWGSYNKDRPSLRLFLEICEYFSQPIKIDLVESQLSLKYEFFIWTFRISKISFGLFPL